MKININYKAPSEEISSGISSEEMLGPKFLGASFKYICSGSQPVLGAFQKPRCQVLGHKTKGPMYVSFQDFQLFKL
jgi:hypothetical protein